MSFPSRRRILALLLALPVLLTACTAAPTGDASSAVSSASTPASSQAGASVAGSEGAAPTPTSSAPTSSTKAPSTPAVAVYKLPFKKGIAVNGIEFGSVAGYVTEASTYAEIKGKGFDHVRLPVSLRDFYDASSRSFKPEMSSVDTAVKLALDAGLYVTLFNRWSGFAASDAKDAALLADMWETAAERYKGYSDKLSFELISGPDKKTSPSDDLNAAQNAAVARIRKHSADRLVMLTVTDGSQAWKIPEFSPPAGDKHLALSIQSYNPGDFTHQGTAGHSSTQVRLEDIGVGSINWDLQQIEDYDYTHSDCPVLLSEFGVVLTVADPNDVTLYLSMLRTRCESSGVPWVYSQYVGGNMGIRATADGPWNEAILKGLGLD